MITSRECVDCGVAIVARRVTKRYCARCKKQRDDKAKRAYDAKTDRTEYLREYRIKNREHIQAQGAEYWIKNREKLRAFSAVRRKTDHGRKLRRQHENKRRAIKRAVAVEELPIDYINILFEQQAGMCFLCHSELQDDNHIEHKTPLSRGGAHAMDNLGLAHAECNMSKGTMTHAEWFFGRQAA